MLINLQSFNTSKVKYMNRMFWCNHLLKIIDIGNFDIKNVINFEYMFNHCWMLTSLILPNAKENNKIENMNNMFELCSNLTSIDLSKIDTTNVKYMNSMFKHCTSLKTIHFGNFKTGNVIEMSKMFYRCSSITSLNLDTFNTSKVQKMDEMFCGCSKLINLSIINFSSISLLYYNNMFYSVNNSIKIRTNDDFKIFLHSLGF